MVRNSNNVSSIMYAIWDAYEVASNYGHDPFEVVCKKGNTNFCVSILIYAK
jgi:hypothetical protein